MIILSKCLIFRCVCPDRLRRIQSDSLVYANYFAIGLGIRICEPIPSYMKRPVSPGKFAAILSRFLNGNASPKESDRVKKWIESVGESKNFSLTKEELEQIREKLWNNLQKETNGQGGRSWIFATRAGRIAYGIAASILLLLLSVLYLDIPVGEKGAVVEGNLAMNRTVYFSSLHKTEDASKEIALADGTIVRLEPRSRLSVNDLVHDSVRIVKLEGAAFFQVAKDDGKPFLVYSEELVTTVLGTSFSITAPGKSGEIIVSVSSGKVSVSSARETSSDNTRQQLILLPNQKAVFDRVRNKLTAGIVEEPQVVKKRSAARLVFDEVAVSTILDSIEASFGIPVEYDHEVLRNCKVTTAFTEEGLYEQLEIISRIIGATYTVEGAEIRFSSTGCN